MKKALPIIVIIIFSASLYSAEPLVKFYLQDGSSKQYNLGDIDSLNIIEKKNNYVMRIHYSDSRIAYYPTEIIASIKFEKDSVKRDILNVYIFSYPKSYILSSIDSVIFYIDQYQPLTIGKQVWMLKNLNVDHYRNGDLISEEQDATAWSYLKTGAWCYYYNDPVNGLIYGKLYNWYAVNDSRGIAPEGWNVASEYDWKELEIFLGMSREYVDMRGFRGTDQGGKLKTSGTKQAGDGLWLSPNTGATNESGFSTLPGGYRSNDGDFDDIGYNSNWWSTEEFGTAYAWSRYLYYDYASIYRSNSAKDYGFSVRCIKD